MAGAGFEPDEVEEQKRNTSATDADQNDDKSPTPQRDEDSFSCQKPNTFGTESEHNNDNYALACGAKREMGTLFPIR